MPLGKKHNKDKFKTILQNICSPTLQHKFIHEYIESVFKHQIQICSADHPFQKGQTFLRLMGFIWKTASNSQPQMPLAPSPPTEDGFIFL